MSPATARTAAVLLALGVLSEARAQPDAGAAPPDAAALYALSTDGTSARVQAGAQGTFVLAVLPQAGAHVSPTTPLTLELTGHGLTPARARLAAADAVGGGGADAGMAGPRFEVPFTANAPGAGAVEARLTFYVCTGSVCARQQRTLRVPVEVL